MACRHLQVPPVRGRSMSDDREAMVEERLSVFDDEPDLNDWVEVMCGAAMAVLGIFHLVEPGNLVCLLYTSPSPRDSGQSRMPSSA